MIDEHETVATETVLLGAVASLGFGRGPLFVIDGDIGDGEDNPARVRPVVLAAPEGAVIIAGDLTPAECMALSSRRPAGVALRRGSATSHVAVMAQERGWPLVIRLAGQHDADLDSASGSGEVLLDAVEGRLVLRPTAETAADFGQRADAWRDRQARDAAVLPRPAMTRDGERVAVRLVIDQLSQLRGLDPAHADGIGLVRSEMLFADRLALPGEEGQFGAYRLLLQWADGRPVAIRLFDPGGGKALPGVDAGALRGVAFGLAHPGVLGAQLRALLRAAAQGDLAIVLPMVANAGEVAAIRDAVAANTDALRRAGRPFGRVRVNAMVETTGALEHLGALDVDGFSIGLGDLAEALGEPRVAGSPAPSGVLRAAVARIVQEGAATGRPVWLCGALAGDPALSETWLRLGVRGLCVPAAALASVKAAVATVELRARA